MFLTEDITTGTERKMHPWQETYFPERFLAQRQDSVQIKRDKCIDAPIKGAEDKAHSLRNEWKRFACPATPLSFPSCTRSSLMERASIIHARRITQPPAVRESLAPLPFSSPTSGCKVFLFFSHPPPSFSFLFVS